MCGSCGSVPRLITMSASRILLLVSALFLCPGDSRIISDTVTFLKQSPQTFDLCSECSQMLQLSTNMIHSTDTKKAVYERLQLLCHNLPADQAAECDAQVKTYLPKVLQKSPGHQKSAETCSVFGLCDARNEQKRHHHADKTPSEHSKAKDEEINPACSFCLFLIRKLETLLPKNITEDALLKMMTQFCQFVPHRYKDNCDQFVTQYGAEVVEFLLSSAAPHTICNLLHLCWFTSHSPVTAGFPDLVPPSDCESCRTLELLSRIHLDLNSTRTQTSAFLESVCDHHPNAVPKCEMFTRIYGSRLQQVLEKQLEHPDVCERADLCASRKKSEQPVKYRCARGPSYWCRDVKTAQACGNEAFCEKFAWKQKE